MSVFWSSFSRVIFLLWFRALNLGVFFLHTCANYEFPNRVVLQIDGNDRLGLAHFASHILWSVMASLLFNCLFRCDDFVNYLSTIQ